jgi:hypothetical protein
MALAGSLRRSSQTFCRHGPPLCPPYGHSTPTVTANIYSVPTSGHKRHTKDTRWWELNGAQDRPLYIRDARGTVARFPGEGVFRMSLRVVPEGLSATSGAIEALTTRLTAAHTGAAPLISAVLPPADAVRRSHRRRKLRLPGVSKSWAGPTSVSVSRAPAMPQATRPPRRRI